MLLENGADPYVENDRHEFAFDFCNVTEVHFQGSEKKKVGAHE